MDYKQQANDFLNKTNTTILVKFKKLDKYFINDKENRFVFEIKMIKNNREYIFSFGDSIANKEKIYLKYFGEYNNYVEKNILNLLKTGEINMFSGIGRGKWNKLVRFKKYIDKIKNWDKAGIDGRPDNYDILACLNTYDDNITLDDFAREYGYTIPSEAIDIYNKVKDQILNLKLLYNDEELEQLNNID